MRILGLYADDAVRRFAPEQHVNVWEVLPAAFLCEARMDSLPEEVLEDPEGYFLEPTDAEGTPITVNAALLIQGAAAVEQQRPCS